MTHKVLDRFGDVAFVIQDGVPLLCGQPFDPCEKSRGLFLWTSHSTGLNGESITIYRTEVGESLRRVEPKGQPGKAWWEVLKAAEKRIELSNK